MRVSALHVLRGKPAAMPAFSRDARPTPPASAAAQGVEGAAPATGAEGGGVNEGGVSERGHFARRGHRLHHAPSPTTVFPDATIHDLSGYHLGDELGRGETLAWREGGGSQGALGERKEEKEKNTREGGRSRKVPARSLNPTEARSPSLSLSLPPPGPAGSSLFTPSPPPSSIHRLLRHRPRRHPPGRRPPRRRQGRPQERPGLTRGGRRGAHRSRSPGLVRGPRRRRPPGLGRGRPLRLLRPGTVRGWRALRCHRQ